MMMKEMIKRIKNLDDLQAEKKRLKLEANVLEYNLLDNLQGFSDMAQPIVSIFDGSTKGLSFIAKGATVLIPLLMSRKKKKPKYSGWIGIGTTLIGLLLGETGHNIFKKIGNIVSSFKKKVKKL